MQDPKTIRSLKDRLMARRAETSQVLRGIGAQVVEARDAATPAIANLFLTAVRGGDILGVNRLALTMSPQSARKQWNDLSYEARFKQLEGWATEGDVNAHHVINTIDDYRANNAVLFSTVMQVLTKVAAPSWNIRTRQAQEEFIAKLLQEGLVERAKEEPYGTWKYRASDGFWISPKRGVLLGNLGWRYLSNVDYRVGLREREQADIQTLLDTFDEETTMPAEPSERGLYSLVVNHVEGRLLVVHRRFMQRDKLGMFAVLVSGTKKGRSFRITADRWVAKHPTLELPHLPEKGYTLPADLEVTDDDKEGARIRFGELEELREQPEFYQAVRAMERLLNSRLREEHRDHRALENPQNLETPQTVESAT